MLTALKLLITAGLGAAYLTVAFLAAHPRMDAEYEAHFVHRTADCWIPQALRADDAAQLAVVELGRAGYPEACRYLRRWWHELEDWGAWSSGTKAVLGLPRRPGTYAVELTLRAAPPPNPAIRVRFVLNGRVTEDEIQPGTIKTVTLPLLFKGEPHDLSVQLTFQNQAIIPSLPFRPNRYQKGEMRRVGLGLIAIRYLPAQPETLEGGKL